MSPRDVVLEWVARFNAADVDRHVVVPVAVQDVDAIVQEVGGEFGRLARMIRPSAPDPVWLARPQFAAARSRPS